jgi:hypothetical protein
MITRSVVSYDVLLLLVGIYGGYNMEQSTRYAADFYPTDELAYFCTYVRSLASLVCMLSVATLLISDQIPIPTPPPSRDDETIVYGIVTLSRISGYVGVTVSIIISVSSEAVTQYAKHVDDMSAMPMYGLLTLFFGVLNILMLGSLPLHSATNKHDDVTTIVSNMDSII